MTCGGSRRSPLDWTVFSTELLSGWLASSDSRFFFSTGTGSGNSEVQWVPKANTGKRGVLHPFHFARVADSLSHHGDDTGRLQMASWVS